MGAKTISFPKGKGHLTHNNRDFISQNVVPERTSWNRIYIQVPLEAAYEKCFGEALRNYNAAQKRKDRIKEDYLYEIRHSKNGEKDFYENVVQIGTMENTPVVDENGELTEDAEAAIRVLEQYAKTFQERNPNLYLFNCVMHLDEKTPHLHMDYIPVAHGYKTGLETRNSLTKAFQQMGFAKAVSRKQNETVAWQERERAYLTKLCMEQGIEIEVLGIKRDNLSLPEYKEVMRKVESLEAEAEKLDLQNGTLEQENESLQEGISMLQNQVHEIQQVKDDLYKQKKELADETKKLENGIEEKTREYQKIDGELNKLKTKKKDFERDVHVYEEKPEWQLPEPAVLTSAKEYRVKVALPLVKKLKNVIFDLTIRCIQSVEGENKYKTKSDKLQQDVNRLNKTVQEQRSTISALQLKARLLEDIEESLGKSRVWEIAEAANRRRNIERLNKKGKDREIAL